MLHLNIFLNNNWPNTVLKTSHIVWRISQKKFLSRKYFNLLSRKTLFYEITCILKMIKWKDEKNKYEHCARLYKKQYLYKYVILIPKFIKKK